MNALQPDQKRISSTTVRETAQATISTSRYRWIVLLTIWFAFAISVIDRMAWANVSTSYAQSLGLPIVALGSFFSAFYIGYFITNAVSGFAADWFGGRRMVTLSLLALGAITFSFSFSNSIAIGLVIQAAMGFVAGMDYSACVKLLSDSFHPSEKATAMGLFLTSVPVGLTLSNLLVPTLLQTSGWQGVYRALGAATMVVGIAAFCLLRGAHHARIVTAAVERPPFGELLHNRGVLVSAFGGFGTLWGAWGFAFWSNALLIKAHGIPSVQAGFIIALFGGSGIVAKPFAGWLADRVRFSKAALSVFWSLAFAVSLSIFGYLGSTTAFMVATIVAGFTAWSAAVLIATLVLENAGPALSGSSSGLANALWMLGNVLVPMVVGAVFQLTHSFHASILVLAAGPLLGAIILLFMPRTDMRRSAIET
ncbi:MFS transporter [Burkholderia pseudomallei]|nr:MFS transporter [Burkholderia pseudomallei]